MEKMQENYNYEDRPNQDALEKQREKYIRQEIDWLFSSNGMDFVNNIIKSITFSDNIETDEIDVGIIMKNRVEAIIDKIEENLRKKNPASVFKQKEDEKFEEEFSREIIKQQMIDMEIIDKENNILLNRKEE